MISSVGCSSLSTIPQPRVSSEAQPKELSLFECLYGTWTQPDYLDELESFVDEFSLEPPLEPTRESPLAPPRSSLDYKHEEELSCLGKFPTRKCSAECSTQLEVASVQSPPSSADALVDQSTKEQPEMSLHQSSLSHRLSTEAAAQVPAEILAFESIQLKKGQFAITVCKVIDRQPISLEEVMNLDEETLTVLSNFCNLVLGNSQKLSKTNLKNSLRELNEKLASSSEKKKRNEERIKYTFKRVNRLLLSRFEQSHYSNNARDTGSVYQEDLIRAQFIQNYFGEGHQILPEATDISQTQEKVFGLLFSPTNLYRKDLKTLFGHRLYRDHFSSVLREEYLPDYLNRRSAKVGSYIAALREDLYFSPDKTDDTLLAKRLKRLPWTKEEVVRGQNLLLALLQEG